ncbi:radical SAM family heme chaperone HemW [Bacteroidales bacterium OttesenSCG-928-K22]|nr:radical SAM family heme chaperone HemW [Bacteroidales bacterium OttesenSCG-928-L14]MDL2240612.1 radical SAM family heme chaperone HemW [Bacteroidales bacterium OttesenSCG-928-K22]
MLPSSSIYIHFPFCKSKCYYCNFFSEINSNLSHDEYIVLLLNESLQRKNYLNNTIVNSIYLGGGTPSVFDPKLISGLLNALDKIFNVAKNAEITIEVNPDDITEEYLKILSSYTNINRISVGVQSFNDNELKLINRRHSSEKAIKSLELISKYYDNISIDLIYSLPMQDLESLNHNINIALSFNPQHISAYSLTLEKETHLFKQIQKGEVNIPSEDEDVDFYLFLTEQLKNNGYDHYEISNFCLQGYESKHNSAYWTGNTYLGLGPGAHSFNGVQRRWNLSSINTYKSKLESGNNYFETEDINIISSFNEYIMLGLRTKKGISLDYISDKFGIEFLQNTKKALLLIPQQHIVEKDMSYALNDAGMLFADKYASCFLFY